MSKAAWFRHILAGTLFMISSPAWSTPEKTQAFPVNPLARYGLPAISQIWGDEYRFKTYFEIEGYINEALAELNIIDPTLPARYWKNGKFTVDEIREHEKITQHEFLAFLAALGNSLGDDAKSVHYGVTSSNVLDTGFNIQLSKSLDLIDTELDRLLVSLKDLSIQHKNTLCIGRTHGVQAEPMSFGLKLLRFYAEFKRHKTWLNLAKQDISVCSIGGAVGNFVHISPQVEAYVSKKLQFTPEPIASQVIPRDRYARLFSIMSVVAASIEELATEIRHLQRSEVAELQESFKEGQKGSSAMPHKRNPIKAENLVGMARIIRSTVVPAIENVSLWHERDMSHSSVERFIAPQSCILLHYALNTMGNLIQGLKVNENAMTANIAKSGNVFFSQRLLLALIQKGLTRDEGYRLMQKTAHQAIDHEQDFTQLIRKDPKITARLNPQELDRVFDINYYLGNVDTVFERVLGGNNR